LESIPGIHKRLKIRVLITLSQNSLPSRNYFSPGCQPTLSCRDILREPNFSLASRYIANWKAQQKMFWNSLLYLELALSRYPFAVGMCLQKHSVQCQPRCFTVSSTSKIRNQVVLVTVIIYSAKSLPSSCYLLQPPVCKFS
jgi:hypothetical protein